MHASPKDVDSLLSSLDGRGVRELALQGTLAKHAGAIEASMRRAAAVAAAAAAARKEKGEAGSRGCTCRALPASPYGAPSIIQ